MSERDRIVENSETRFEASDMNARAVGFVGLGLFVFLALAPFLLTLFYSPATKDVDRALSIRPPQPELQLNPANDLAKLRAAKEDRLQSYGWVDREHGIIHIPIDRAMDTIAAQGIPDFPKPP